MKEAEIIFDKHIDLSRFSRRTIPRDSMLHSVIMNAMQEYAKHYHKQQLQKKLEEVKNPYSQNKQYEQWAAVENFLDMLIRNGSKTN